MNYFCYRRPASILARHRDRIRIYSAVDGGEFVFGKEDLFVAYSAWQAIWAAKYVEKTIWDRFAFFIQEYEPVFHPHDSTGFIVNTAYGLPHLPIFNSDRLRRHFQEKRLGVFRTPAPAPSIAFEHVLTPLREPTSDEIAKRGRRRRFLVYARPEDHAARNLFEICVIVLRAAIERGEFDGREYEFLGIGALTGSYGVDLGKGNTLKLMAKVDPADYPALLRGADIGMSLMYAPHPSLTPYEMVNAGIITITNTYDTRNKASIEAISPRLIAAEPDMDDLGAALRRAIALAENVEIRTNPAYRVASPASWREVFDHSLLNEMFTHLTGEGLKQPTRSPQAAE